MNQWQDGWYERLSIAKFAHNDWVHTLTCTSPFMLDTTQKHQLGIEPLRESHLETLNDFTSRMDMAMEEAHSDLTRAADDMHWFHNAHQREAPCMR